MEHQILFGPDQITAVVARLAAEIDADLRGQDVTAVVVLKGAVVFASDLIRAMETEVKLAFVTASSYSGFTPGESVEIDDSGFGDVRDHHVLIVEDIVDTGRTLTELSAAAKAMGATDVSTVTLISKTSRRAEDFEPTYHGFEIGEEFIYGYGLDWDERYRDLPFVARASV